MISFNLKCDKNHEFEGWFKDSRTFEDQKKQGLLECGFCGSSDVTKALSAPNISTGRSKEKSQVEAFHKTRNALLKIRKDVEKNSENVGENFTEEARKIHYGEAEKRNIYGQASATDVKELSEEGVNLAVIPWIDEEKIN